ARCGGVEAGPGAGRIEAAGLSGGRVGAGTASGGIALSSAAPPEEVETGADSGSSVARVPEGPYDITATTDSGGRRIDAAHEAGAPRTIDVRSDSGDVDVLPA